MADPTTTHEAPDLEQSKPEQRKGLDKWVVARRIIQGLLLLAILAAALPFLPTGLFRARVEQTLEAGLQRPVEVGDVRLTLFPSGPFPGPGFTIEDVTIHEDPRAGIEPFAYVYQLGATIDPWSLIRGQFRFSSLNLQNASVNLVKTAAGPWNFQMLLDAVHAEGTPVPTIRLRGGRVNFKFGAVKTPFFFNDADLDVGAQGDGLEIRFSGDPTRSDHTAHDFGRFFVRGTTAPDPGAAGLQQLDLIVELQQSSLEESLRLMDPLGFGVHGLIELDARLTGPMDHVQVKGTLAVNDIHRSDVLPIGPSGWTLPYSGTLDILNERLDLLSEGIPGDDPVVVGLRARDVLTSPVWDAGVEFAAIPLKSLLEISSHMGYELPAELDAEGFLFGTAVYTNASGLAGQLTVSDASVTLPDQEPLHAAKADFDIADGLVTMQPAEITIGENQSAQLQGVYDAATHALDMRIDTPGLSVAAMRSFGLAELPVIEQTPRGTWTGWARYSGGDLESNGAWTGTSTLQNASIQIQGLSEPVEIKTARVRLNGPKIEIDRVTASVGPVPITGSYSFHPGAAVPHTFALTIPQAEAADLRRLLTPTMVRDRSFLSRTFRLGDATPPAWLRQRRATGQVAIDTLTVNTVPITNLRFDLDWNGAEVTFENLAGRIEATRIAGKLSANLEGPLPALQFDGDWNGLPFAGGTLNLTTSASATGFDLAFLTSLRATGMLEARNIALQPVDAPTEAKDAPNKKDSEVSPVRFRSLTGTYTINNSSVPPSWKVTDVEAVRNGVMSQGSGTMTNGVLSLELAGPEETTVRYAAPLPSLAVTIAEE